MRRNVSGVALQFDQRREWWLFDCGEGTQHQVQKTDVSLAALRRVFISHLHGDHYYGLIGLLTSMGLLGRTQDIHLHAPAPLEAILKLQLSVADTKLPYALHFHPLKSAGIIVDDKKIMVECFTTKHRIECWGFLFREKKNPRKVNAERAAIYEIPAAFYDKLQQGHDYVNKKGTIVPNEEVTTAAAKAKSYAFCADTIYDETLAEKVKEVDLLYHEATYLKDLHERAAARFHSTTHQAATIAKMANAKRLLLGHFSSKYETLEAFLPEAHEIFENTELALEGACYRI